MATGLAEYVEVQVTEGPKMVVEDVRWTREAEFRIIKLYRENEFLWNVNNPDYHKRDKKVKVLQSIVESFGRPEIKVSDVVARFKNMRTTFRREEKKKIASLRNGINLYTPRWELYNHLSFLSQLPEQQLVEVECIEASPSHTYEEVPPVNVLREASSNPAVVVVANNYDSSTSFDDSDAGTSSNPKTRQLKGKSSNRKRNRKMSDSDGVTEARDVLSLFKKKAKHEENRLSDDKLTNDTLSFVTMIGVKLDAMTKKTRLATQMKIYQIVFESEINSLEDD